MYLQKTFFYLILTSFIAMICSTATAQTITTIAGNGTWGFSGDGEPATAAELGFPIDVFMTPAGDLYIADEWNNRIRMINNSGTITTIAGNGSTAWASEGVPATTVGINHPRAVCVDVSGNIYIADEGNARIRLVTTAGLIYNAAGNGTMAYSGDGGPATDASIDEPWGVCTDASGNLYIGDEVNDAVRKVNTSGIISTIAGTGVGGFSGDGGAATIATLLGPAGVCFDGAGNMYVADLNRIRKINPSGTISTIAGTGTAGYSGDGGPSTAAAINEVIGICTDTAGNLYVADQGNNVIRKISTAGVITTYAGSGVAGFSGDNGAATAAKLSGPTGVCTDAAGNLYVADYNNQRIRKVTPVNAGVGIVSTGAAIQVYPNPATSLVLVDCKQLVDIKILDLEGRVLLTALKAKEISIGQLAPGNYLIAVFDPVTGARLYSQLIRKE